MTLDTSKYLQNPTNGLYYTKFGQLVCEDCGEPIPFYRDFRSGLVSPESDKSRDQVMGDGHVVHTVQEKAVCLPCYNLAFKRVYPDAPLPKISSDVVENTQVVDATDEQLAG